MSERPPDLRHLFLIDGSGFIFRAFHALPPLSRSDGTPTNAVLGFCNMLMKLIEDTEADHVAVIFDKGRRSFRNDIYPDYKAHRPDPPEELVPQFGLVRDATRAFNVPAIEVENFEADDIIATYARQAAQRGARVTIVSSDKDLMQLVDERIEMLDAVKNRTIGPDQVREKFGVAPDRVVDVQALAGDSTDNVPGVPGIGVKTAAQLIEQYGDLETLLGRAGEIPQPKRRERLIEHAEDARMSRRLVELRDDVPLEEGLDAFVKREPDLERLVAFLKAQDFDRLLARVQARYGNPDGEAGTALAVAAAPADVSYELVQDIAALDRWIAAAHEAGQVAVDTETTSLDPMRAALVGVSLSVIPGRACYIPLGHRGSKAQGALDLGDAGGGHGGGHGGGDDVPAQIPADEALARLAPLLADPSVLKVGHNIKYDMAVLGRHGVAVAPVDDTMVLSYVLDGGARSHSLDELASAHLGHDTIKFTDVAGSGRAQVTFDLVPLDKARDYAAEDADITGRLHRLLKPRLVRERLVSVYETLDRPLIPLLVAMEAAGIKVDAQALRALSDDFTARLAGLEAEIHQLAGRAFNVGSPKQLGEILFQEMGLTGGRKGKTGAWGTGAEVLERLAAEGHDLPARVLDWRQVAKLKSTYADALVRQIDPRTGRVHTSYGLTATTTGRLSSSEPNLQNIPVRTEEGRKIRRAFVAEPGHALLSADYSQIELRLLAHVADIAPLKTAFRDGLDIHALTAAEVFGVPVEGMDPAVRRRAKAINFGIIYGISAFGLARQLGISNSEAAAYIDAYFGRFPGIRDYMERTRETARSQGFVTTLFGRKVHTPGINDRNPSVRSFAERAAINAPIQGGAADIIKRAMVRLPRALDDAGLSARMLLQVHDELVFEVPDDQLDATEATVRRVMEAAARLSVPLTVDCGHGPTWDDAH